MTRLMLFLPTSLLICSMASADIVGMWLFDEGKGDAMADSSKKGHDGKLHDGFEWVDGKFGKGIHLDSTGYMELEHHEDFNFPEALTIMVWANISEITPQEWVGMPRKENEYVLAAHRGNKVEMTMWVHVGGGWIGPIPALGSGIQVDYGEWHHYATTYDGDICRVYVDGKESGSQQVGGPLNQTNAVVRISNSCCGGRFMNGIIDEVIMANECFTEEEINTFMLKGASLALPVEPGARLAIKWGEIKRELRIRD